MAERLSKPSKEGETMVRRMFATIAVGLFVVAGSSVHAAVDAGDLCKEAKAKAAGKKAFDLLKAFGKNTKKPNDARLAQDISKAQSKFTKDFSKAEIPGQCDTSDDSGTIETKVDALVFKVPSLDLWNEKTLLRLPKISELRDPINVAEWGRTMLGESIAS